MHLTVLSKLVRVTIGGMQMQSKRKVILGALVTVVALSGGYIFWPEESPTGETHIDPSAQANKLFDKLSSVPSWTANVSNPNVINGHVVPPMPDPIENKKTVAGIDIDNNGIRDDVDRYVAENFGNDSIYDAVVREEQQLQAMLISPTKENGRLYSNENDCVVPFSLSEKVFHERSMRMSKLTHVTVNTNARGGAYAMALAGSNLGKCSRK